MNIYQVPILFIIFNKVNETQQVFSAIRRQKPERLFIAADGPRPEKPGEAETCKAVREQVLESIDWECDVQTMFREQNVGCGRGPSEAITWFFSHVPEGIILEDDCLPNDTFFHFCSKLLSRYRDDERISIISGNNFQPDQPVTENGDYFFSLFPSTNGWAAWKRSWDGYDYHISSWETMGKGEKKKMLAWMFREEKYRLWWDYQFNWLVKIKPDDMWDYQFHYYSMKRRQLAIKPAVNLVSNIGYGPDATHSSNPHSYFANFPVKEIPLPFKHPVVMKRHYEADLFSQMHQFGEIIPDSRFKKMKRFIKQVIRYQPAP